MILNDRQIRGMCMFSESAMIQPFLQMQVGKPSYGLGSFGYDMRLGTKFLLASRIDIIADPIDYDKNLCHVLKREDEFILHPGHHVLTESVETFNMPNDVCGVCWGKSSYARCFSGDTKVSLLRGTEMSLEDMYEAKDQDDFFVYSIDEKGDVQASKVRDVLSLGEEEVISIVLDNGETIKATEDHEFILRDGSVCKAGMLKPGSSLMPLYRKSYRGYEGHYVPVRGRMNPTHRIADAWNLRHGVYAGLDDQHRHHINKEKNDNRPSNIARKPAREHLVEHNKEMWSDEEFCARHAESISKGLSRILDTEEYKKAQSDRSLAFWNDPAYAARKEALIEYRSTMWTDDMREQAAERMRERMATDKDAHSMKMKKAWEEASDERRDKQRELMRSVNIRMDIDEESVSYALARAGSIRGASRILNCDRSVFRRFPEAISMFKAQKNNHKVVDVVRAGEKRNVFCLSVPEFGNFALSSGVFVMNCGLLVNVTPLEPGWKGILTLELANVSPNPIRLHVGKGIAQVVFFRGDRPDRTYTEKESGGIYQGQTGVTVPQ